MKIEDLSLSSRGGFLVRIKKSGKEIPPSFLVFDDIISDIPQRTKTWERFIGTFRHYNLTLFFTSQYPNMIECKLRSQTEFAYLFQMHNKAQFESSYDAFGQLLESVHAWRAYLNKYTGKYRCVIWDREALPELALKYKQFKAPSQGKPVRFEF